VAARRGVIGSTTVETTEVRFGQLDFEIRVCFGFRTSDFGFLFAGSYASSC